MNNEGKMEKDLFEKVLDKVFGGVYLVDRTRKITYWNKGAERITGYKKGKVMGFYCFDNILDHIDESGKNLCHDGCPLAATMKDGKERQTHVFLRHADGYRVPVIINASPMRDDKGKIIGAVETFSDNSLLQSAQKNIAYLSDALMRDELTQIGNRRLAELTIKKYIENIKLLGGVYGILFIDIDYFKQINDQFGHDKGDEILKLVAVTLKTGLREDDFVARWGGEEFIVVLENIKPEFVESVAEKLRMLVEKSAVRNGPEEISVTISIGATITRKNDTVESLLQRADALMYKSKDGGRNQVVTDVETAV